MRAAATIVEVSGRRFEVPLDCPCCGAAPDAEIAVPLARSSRERAADSAASIDMPYCLRCVGHVARWQSAAVVLTGLIVLGSVAFVVAAIASWIVTGLVVLVGLTALGAVVATSRRREARRACQPSCGSVDLSVAYLGYSGTTTGLAFKSIAYGAKFAERNTARLVEDARIRRLLEHYKLARIAVPTPAAAISVIPPPLDAGEWIARLTTTTTRVARRGALAGALEVLHDRRDREQLVRTVAAIELSAYVAPLDRMPSAAARRRHLRATLDQVRRDNVPEPLQDLLVRELEQRLAGL